MEVIEKIKEVDSSQKNYASKGVANTGLGLGIAGTALGLLALGSRGRGFNLFGGGYSMPENVNINTTMRSGGVAPTSFQVWEKECEDALKAQADMYNLYPSVGAVNAIRSNYNFAELPEDVDFIIDACNFKVLGHKVEPADMCKGEIARTYLYFDSEYPTYSMSKQSRRMMDAWNVLYPVTPWECTRAKRIEEIQGNPNPFVKEPCIEQGLYR